MGGRAILIVEDDARLGGILLRALERRGHTVRLVTSVADAQRALAAGRPDALLLDIDLPDGTGWELLDGFAAAGSVIVMSAGQPARRRLDEFQPMCFLSKPFAIDTLLALVEGDDDVSGAGPTRRPDEEEPHG
jgi:DNA-binding response OmpR family regulator